MPIPSTGLERKKTKAYHFKSFHLEGLMPSKEMIGVYLVSKTSLKKNWSLENYGNMAENRQKCNSQESRNSTFIMQKQNAKGKEGAWIHVEGPGNKGESPKKAKKCSF